MARRRTSLPGFDDLPLLLNADEVAQLLRVSRKAVYTMAERGELPGVTKLGRRLRFRRDALEAWIASSSLRCHFGAVPNCLRGS